MFLKADDTDTRARSGAERPRRGSPRPGGWIALALAAALAGCATQAEGDMVYLKQHRASIALTQILLIAESDNPALLDRLYDVETALNAACAPLQEAAYRKLNKEPVYPLLKLKAYGALDTCDAKASEIEDLLWRIDPETAGYYLNHPLVSVRSDQ